MRPAMRLMRMLVMNPPILPFWSICRLSLAKVENVVKPPQKPVVSRRKREFEMLVYFENREWML